MDLSHKIKAVGRKIFSGRLKSTLSSSSKSTIASEGSITTLVIRSPRNEVSKDLNLDKYASNSTITMACSSKADFQEYSAGPQFMFGVWYNSGTLWVHLTRAKNLPISKGYVYAKTYLLPDCGNSKQKTSKTGDLQDPEFNATIAYFVEEKLLPSRILNLSVWNRTSLFKNKVVGHIELPLVSLNLKDPSHHWYHLETECATKTQYKQFKSVPPAIRIALCFTPDPDCQDMDGSGTLKVSIAEARNLSSLSRVSNLNRVWVYCSLLPDWYTTRERSPQYGYGGSPTWDHTFIYKDKTLRKLLESAVDVSVADCNEIIGRIRLGGYPGRSTKPQLWMDSTDLEAAHWEHALSHPGCRVERWHQVDERLTDRSVCLTKKPPVFVDPFYIHPKPAILQHSKGTGCNYAKGISLSSNSKTNNAEKPPVVVGKLLARVYYEDGKLTVRINRIAGLSGGANKEKLYNPYVKLYLIPGRIKLDKFKTNCLWKTRNPVFNATFQYNGTMEEQECKALKVLVCHKYRLGPSKVIAELGILLSSVNPNDFMDHWYSLYQLHKSK